MNFKQILDQLIATPLLTSLFVVDFAILIFHKPPAFFAFLMLAGLVALAMYFGQKLKLYSFNTPS
ncbi:MAG: hypothetical protein ACU843_06645 [Gammaproteobacteria bacterium]